MAATYNYPGPESVMAYFRSGLHTGRGPGLDDALIDGFIADFSKELFIRDLVEADRIVFSKRAKAGRTHRNIDLVVGPPPGPTPKWADRSRGMAEAAPAEILLAAEVKSIMTEHGKAQRNRRGDMDNHANAMMAINAQAVSIGLCLVNAADQYRSHTAVKEYNDHGNGREKARRAIQELESVGIRNYPAAPYGLDVLCTPVVVVTNKEGEFGGARFLMGPPAPADGTVLSWSHLIKRSARLYGERFR